jgi:putative nucleotidyltransferase with HDIG domain
MPKIIRDPVHGVVELSALELELIDTPQFQRLRNIRQLGLAHLTYPGAHHTRFEHSLGAMFLAGRIASSLGFDEDVRLQLRLAALLHDIGHYPFSHDCEEIVSKKFGDHEKAGAKMACSSPLSDILSRNYDSKKIAQWMGGESYGQAIASDVGADRMDYLLRDAHYTGVAYGIVDWQRIISTLLWDSGKLSLSAAGLEASESLILARFAMFHTVYYHHSVRIARKMLQQAILLSLDDKGFDWDAARAEGDVLMLERMSKVKGAAQWVARIKSRELFKRALVVKWAQIPSDKKAIASSGALAAELSSSAGVPVLVDPPAEFSQNPDILVVSESGRRPIHEVSPIMASLQAAARERATLLISSSKEDMQKVKAAAQKLLGL